MTIKKLDGIIKLENEGGQKMEKNEWITYEVEKQKWLAKHPDATPKEIEQAMREIAKRLNL